MLYNSIAGSTLDISTRAKFEMFTSEKCYFGFSRKDETWGTCALLNITLPTDKVITELLGTDKFTDKNTVDQFDESSSIVHIYRTEEYINDFDGNMTNYYPIDELNDVTLYLDHINDSWCVLRGLPSNYNEYIKSDIYDNTGNLTKYKYYIVPNHAYEINPNILYKDVMVKINEKNISEDLMLIENVSLVMVADNTETIICNGLSKATSLLGELFVYGLDYSYIDDNFPDLSSKANNELNPTNTKFYLLNTKNKKVSEDLYLQSYSTLEGLDEIYNYDNDDKYLLFRTVKNINYLNKNLVKDYYTKISSKISPNELAIYHETLNFVFPTITSTNDISDANPPAFDFSYLINSTIDKSIFEIGGYSKLTLKPNPVYNDFYICSTKFVKQLKSSTEKTKFENLGFDDLTPSNKTFENIKLTSAIPVQRYGNVKAKPNNAPYENRDDRIYIWDLEFLINDVIEIKANINNSTFLPEIRIKDVNYEEDYIILEHEIGSVLTSQDFIDSSFNRTNSQIRLKTSSNILKENTFAVVDNLDDALKYKMDSVMIDLKMSGDNANLYNDEYRQIFVAYNPKYIEMVNTIPTLKECTGDFYKESGISLFNKSKHQYENGVLLYLGNKNQIHRKYVNGMEQFKIVI